MYMTGGFEWPWSLLGGVMLAIAVIGLCVVRLGAASALCREALLRRVVMFYSGLLLVIGGLATAGW